MAAAIKCVAVDDHAAVREGLALLLDGSDDIDLVDAVPSGEEAVEAVKRHDAEVVIVDVRLPGMDGISTVRRLAADAPQAGTVMFSAYGDRRLLSHAISAGARGYVTKGAPPEDLLRAIRTVSEGAAFVDPSLSPALLMTTGVVEAPLSEREREILQLLAEGLHTEEVAKRIGLSAETVKSDTKRAITKLEADSRVHAVAIALRKALID